MAARARRDKRRVQRGLFALVTLIGLTASLLITAPDAVGAPAPAGAAGSLDTTFGSAGIARVSVPGLALTALTRALVQVDGKVVVAGSQPDTAGTMVVARLNTNGTLDTSFGNGAGFVKPGLGAASADVVGAWGFPGLGRGQIALLATGKIVVTGADATGTKVAVARLMPDGSLDSTFGSSGIATTPLAPSNCPAAPNQKSDGSKQASTHGSGVVAQPDSKILVSAWN